MSKTDLEIAAEAAIEVLKEISTVGGKYGYHKGEIVYDSTQAAAALKAAMRKEPDVQKYRVHTYQTFRVTYEINATSADEAKNMIFEDGWAMHPVATDYENPDWTDDCIVDPILPNGEIDYPNVKNWFGGKQ